ncbi:unnamed protein product [Cylicocyclus nassatus]|uniref:Uncharacterized protein n=1 Tax=Cylicocyclus nassatus TaxID=53992 RepID=A0AA36MCZ2_CYLNA|nr:unnamed protein product [Cylicocyclus nassatus]
MSGARDGAGSREQANDEDYMSDVLEMMKEDEEELRERQQRDPEPRMFEAPQQPPEEDTAQPGPRRSRNGDEAVAGQPPEKRSRQQAEDEQEDEGND